MGIRSDNGEGLLFHIPLVHNGFRKEFSTDVSVVPMIRSGTLILTLQSDGYFNERKSTWQNFLRVFFCSCSDDNH